MGLSVIENELGKMTNAERLAVIEIAKKLLRGGTIKKPKLSLDEKRARLRSSAAIMASEYKGDASLTEMTALDSEDFKDA
jgi:DNA-binding Lrp family transcriptional regulator